MTEWVIRETEQRFSDGYQELVHILERGGTQLYFCRYNMARDVILRQGESDDVYREVHVGDLPDLVDTVGRRLERAIDAGEWVDDDYGGHSIKPEEYHEPATD